MFKVQCNAQCLQLSVRSVKLHIGNFSRRHKRATEDDEKESPDGHKINLEPNFWEKKCSHLIGKNFFFRPKNRKTEATKHFRRNINPVFFPVRLFGVVIINSNECFCPGTFERSPDSLWWHCSSVWLRPMRRRCRWVPAPIGWSVHFRSDRLMSRRRFDLIRQAT